MGIKTDVDVGSDRFTNGSNASLRFAQSPIPGHQMPAGRQRPHLEGGIAVGLDETDGVVGCFLRGIAAYALVDANAVAGLTAYQSVNGQASGLAGDVP